MEKIFKLLNKKYDERFDACVEVKKKRSIMEETFKEFHLEYLQKEPLDFFHNEMIYQGIQNKKKIEDAFFMAQTKMVDFYFALDYQERQRLINVDIEEALLDLPFVKMDGVKTYIPFFDERMNQIYQNEMVLFDIKKYRNYVLKFADIMQEPLQYCNAFYSFPFSSVQLVYHQGQQKVLYCPLNQCIYFFEDGKEINHLHLLHECDLAKMEQLVLLYFSKERETFVLFLEKNDLIKEKELNKINKYMKKVKK